MMTSEQIEQAAYIILQDFLDGKTAEDSMLNSLTRYSLNDMSDHLDEIFQISGELILDYMRRN